MRLFQKGFLCFQILYEMIDLILWNFQFLSLQNSTIIVNLLKHPLITVLQSIYNLLKNSLKSCNNLDTWSCVAIKLSQIILGCYIIQNKSHVFYT